MVVLLVVAVYGHGLWLMCKYSSSIVILPVMKLLVGHSIIDLQCSCEVRNLEAFGCDTYYFT